MDLQLYSIEQMPRTVPLWDTILDDLGRPPPCALGRALGVGRATIYRWNASGHAPRTALLALFWLTRWGRSTVNAQAVNDALMAVQLARSYREECNKLRASGPDEIAWPAIEPADPPTLSARENPSATGADGLRLSLVGTETSPQQPTPLRVPARSSPRAESAPSPHESGGGTTP